MKLYEQIENHLRNGNLLEARRLALGGFREMTDREIVAYWNTLQMPGLIVDSVGVRPLHLDVVSQVLTEREINHQRGCRTVAA